MYSLSACLYDQLSHGQIKMGQKQGLNKPACLTGLVVSKTQANKIDKLK